MVNVGTVNRSRAGPLARLSVAWAVVLVISLLSGFFPVRSGPSLARAQDTAHEANGVHDMGYVFGARTEQELRPVHFRKLNADTDLTGEDGVDDDGDGDGEYEYVEVEDGDDDPFEDADDEDHQEESLAFGKLSSSDIASKDVFSARMQDVLSHQEHSKKSKRAKIKLGKRYLAPERGADDLSYEGRGGKGHVGRSHQSNFIEVTFLTIGMALSAGFGAVPFFFVRNLSPTMNGLATAVACGVMFAASFDLIHEGQPYGATMVVMGIGLGAVFIQYMKRYLDSLGDVSFGKLHGAKAKRLILIVGIMAAHAIGEGCGVGVSFVGERGFDQGLLTTLAIGIHNIPEGMAKATVLVSQGASPMEALIWSVATCLPQPLMAIPSFVFVNMFEFLLPISLGFAAGCMIWMVFAELLPDALKDCDAGHVASAATFSAAGLEGFRMLMESVDQAYGRGYGGGPDYPAFEDTSSSGYHLPTNIKFSFGMVLGIVSIVTSWAPHMARIADATIPVVLGMVSVVMGLIGALPLFRDLFTFSEAPRLHILSAAAIGMIGIVLLRNIILDRSHAILLRLREKGDGFLGATMGPSDGNQTGANGSNGTSKSAMSAMNNHRLPSRMNRGDHNLANSPYPPLRALAVILVATSILHAMVCGAQLQRVGVEYGDYSQSDTSGGSSAPNDPKSLSLAAAYGGLFGIIAGCSSFLWELHNNPSVIRSSLVAFIISGACILAHQAVVLPNHHWLILPYPRGVLDTLSYVAHGALAMTALLTLAVGMSSQPRYTRFGVVLACLLLSGWALGMYLLGTNVLKSVLTL